MSMRRLTPDAILPADGCAGTLIGRVMLPGLQGGPAVVAIRGDGVFDLGRAAPTVSHLLEDPDPVALVRRTKGDRVAGLAELLDAASKADPFLLAPCDLQAIKACGVTFVTSLLERVIEEQVRGDPSQAEAARVALMDMIGGDLNAIRPGSEQALRLRQELVRRNAWSQYLEVGLGADAEIFTKAQPMSAVGVGADVGLHPTSTWNNPEPEIVLAVASSGRVVGATLGNDVNLRDIEGRSALLLGRAKDNNASTAIGPFIRLFDESFTIDDVRRAVLEMTVIGRDGFKLEGKSSMATISRDPLDLVGQAICATHQYPDGMMLFLGTAFAPTADREAPGQGFTHHEGDVVSISTPALGSLVNRVTTSDKAEPWTFGVARLMASLAARGLLAGEKTDVAYWQAHRAGRT